MDGFLVKYADKFYRKDWILPLRKIHVWYVAYLAAFLHERNGVPSKAEFYLRRTYKFLKPRVKELFHLNIYSTNWQGNAVNVTELWKHYEAESTGKNGSHFLFSPVLFLPTKKSVITLHAPFLF